MRNQLFIVLLFFPLLTFSQQPTKEQIKQVEEARKEVKRMKGQSFPDFELTALDGKVYSKEELQGKILLVNFWFSRCGPCIMEMPEMNEMVSEFSDEEIVFLAPTFDSNDEVNRFLEKRDFDYEIIADVKEFCKEMKIQSYPTHFVVNREGFIEKVVIGYSTMTISTLRKSIRKLLKSE